jgi:hypothetical protein
MTRFYNECIYMIKTTEALERDFESGGSGTVPSEKTWSGGKDMYDKAEKRDEALPIVFASADQESGLLYWGVVEKLDFGAAGGTVCHYSGLKRVDGEPPINSLELRSGRKLSADFIRGYALCKTPSFIR